MRRTRMIGEAPGAGAAPRRKLERCRICGGVLGGSLLVREMMFGTRERFLYDQCTDCGCLQIDDFPQDIARHYPGGYYSYDQRRHPRLKRLRRGRRRRWILSAPRAVSALMAFFSGSDELFHMYRRLGLTLGSQLLDVGAGSGGHVLELRDAGVADAMGLDPFLAQDVEWEGRVLVHRKALEDMTGAFDFVTFHHSLEHMPGPVEALSQAKRLLAPGGQVLVRIPTVSSEAFERYREHWVNLDAPRHFFLHSHGSLEIAALKVGLKVSRLWCDSTAMQFMASEQYQRDIPLMDPRSAAAGKGAGLFSRAQRKDYARWAAELNRNLRGDTICALLCAA